MNQLSKRESNRINAALRQSRLSLFDTKEKIASNLNTKNVCEAMNRCTKSIKDYLDIFFCTSSSNLQSKKLFSSIDSEGISNISSICSEIENNDKVLNNMSIRTVFGGTEKMPFRALSYIIPSLNLCEELIEKNDDKNSIPNIEFLFMNGAGIMANAIDPELANNATSQFINFAQKYIEEYHPKLIDNVNFYVDNTFSNSIIKTNEYKQVQEALEKSLSKDEHLREDLVEMGEKRKASANAIRYATLHSFVQDGIVDSNVAKMTNFFGGKEQAKSDVIVSIGAKPEEKFFKARKMVSEAIAKVDYFTPKKTAQYIANINVPPYSPLKTGELYLQDVLRNSNLITKARMRDRKDRVYTEYQVPVQKAIEMIINDVEGSESNKDIYNFIEEYNRSQLNNKDKEKV